MSKIMAGVLHFFVLMPMWFYLMYAVLKSINAEPMLWGIYWAYVPLSVVAGALMHASNVE